MIKLLRLVVIPALLVGGVALSLPAAVAVESADSAGASAAAEGANPHIYGTWAIQDNRLHIKIEPCGEELCGHIVALPSHEEPEQVRDVNNPDADLRSRKLMGLRIMEGFKPQDEDTWQGGTIYRPDNGDTLGDFIFTYRMDLASPDRLVLRACAGQCFDSKRIWRRVN